MPRIANKLCTLNWDERLDLSTRLCATIDVWANNGARAIICRWWRSTKMLVERVTRIVNESVCRDLQGLSVVT